MTDDRSTQGDRVGQIMQLTDVLGLTVEVFGIGEDWKGKFDDLGDEVEVVYLPRTSGISTTEMKRVLSEFDERHVTSLKNTLDTLSQIVKELS